MTWLTRTLTLGQALLMVGGLLTLLMGAFAWAGTEAAGPGRRLAGVEREVELLRARLDSLDQRTLAILAILCVRTTPDERRLARVTCP
jgi:hypothetical protein